MSTIIMSQCWDLEMPPTQKAVLISLADNANDQGVCWPSIPTICRRTCFSERAVQNAIKWLERYRLLTANRSNGRHTSYTLTPGAYSTDTPAADAPQQQMHPSRKRTPAADAPTPAGGAVVPPQQMHQPPQEVPSNRQEPPVEPPGNHQRSPRGDDVLPALDVKALVADGVDRQVAKDWLTLRKAKRLPLTPTAWDDVKAEAMKAGMTPSEAVRVSVLSGWAGFRAKWTENKGQRGAAQMDNDAENAKAKAMLFGAAEVIDV